MLNRRVGRLGLFETERDYAAFERILEEAVAHTGIRLVAYCLMPNHWHLLLWPRAVADHDRGGFALNPAFGPREDPGRRAVGHIKTPDPFTPTPLLDPFTRPLYSFPQRMELDNLRKQIRRLMKQRGVSARRLRSRRLAGVRPRGGRA